MGRSAPRLVLDGQGSLEAAIAGRPLVTANVPGEVWRVGTDRGVCSLGGGVPNARARGPSGFSAGNAYAVGFGGRIVESPGAAAP